MFWSCYVIELLELWSYLNIELLELFSELPIRYTGRSCQSSLVQSCLKAELLSSFGISLWSRAAELPFRVVVLELPCLDNQDGYTKYLCE